MRRIEVPWNALDAMLVVVGWFMLQFLLFVLLGELSFWEPMARFSRALESGDIIASFTVVAANSLLVIGLIWLRLRRYGAGFLELGFKGFQYWRALIYILIGLVAFQLTVAFIYFWLQQLWPSFNPQEEQVNQFIDPNGPVATRISFMALVILPAFVEETMFRGFLFPAFAKRWGVWAGAIISSSLFGLAHLQPNVIIYTLVMGLLLCMMYWKLKSIWPGIIFHGLNNLLAFILILSQ